MSTENKDFDLQAYLTKGVEQVVTDAIKATLKDPKESAFMLRFAAASRAASKKRLAAEKQGEHIPSYLIANMDEFHRRGLIFGASVTVTTENLNEVSSDAFLQTLADRGCKAVIFVEFVPVTEDSRELALGDAEREVLRGEIARLREQHPEMVYIAFPGDEKDSGGCVAAGRGFFHINSHGGAEPCPFSPYSDINVRDSSLREAMNSGLFRALRENGHLLEDHVGGCVLYEKRELVERLLKESKIA